MGAWNSSWVVLQWASVALLVALGLPYLVPGSRRHRGATVRVVLALAAGFALAGAAAETGDLAGPGGILHLGAVLALVCGLVGLLGLLLFDVLLPRLRVDVPSLVRDVSQVAVAAVAVLACLRLVGIDVLPLLTTSAVLTAIIGLALQATIANLFGGLSLQLDRTLQQGDWIETGDRAGRIAEIGWRSTRLVTKEGDTLFLPNSELVSGQVLNLSRPSTAHRESVQVKLHRQNPPGVVRALLVDAIGDVPGVLVYPPPDCVVLGLDDDTVTYAVRYWISEFELDAAIAGEVRVRLWYAARRAGLVERPPLAVVATVEAEASQDDRRPLDWDARLELLRSVDLLAALDDAGRQRFALGMRRLDFAAGEVILRQGTEGDALYLVDRGEVGVRIDVDGSTSEIATLGRGNVFGEMALLTGEPRVATCVARTEVSCYAIERGPFEVLLAERPEIAGDFARTLAARRSALEAQRLGLSAAARARLEADERSRLLTRVRDVFGGGTA